jgi:hypothetical protein
VDGQCGGGGGMFVAHNSLVSLFNFLFQNCTSLSLPGGGIAFAKYNGVSSQSISLQNCFFSNCTSKGTTIGHTIFVNIEETVLFILKEKEIRVEGFLLLFLLFICLLLLMELIC